MEILIALLAQVLPVSAGEAQELRPAVDRPPSVAPWTESSGAFGQAQGGGLSVRPEGEPFTFNVGLIGRWGIPFGAAQDADAIVIGNTVIFEDHFRYEELFDPGFGASIEASFVFLQPERRRGGGRGGGPELGVYVSIQMDEYNGNSERDDFGNEMSVGDLRFFSAIGGIKAAQALGDQAFGDFRIGFGVVEYEEVNAKFTSLGGLSTFQGTLFEATTTYGFELRGRGGYRLGPLAFVGGVGFRVIGQPEESDAASLAGISPKTLFTLDFELGVELGF